MPKTTIEQLDERRNKLLAKAKAVAERRNKIARIERQSVAAEVRIDTRIRGTVHEREAQARWAANPAAAAAELQELDRRLVDARERKAFGLQPREVPSAS